MVKIDFTNPMFFLGVIDHVTVSGVICATK